MSVQEHVNLFSNQTPIPEQAPIWLNTFMAEFQKLHSLANRIDRVEENIKNLISNAIKDESPLDDSKRRAFISPFQKTLQCSTTRLCSIISVFSQTRRRLSGLTRPLDYFTHKVITDPIQRLTAESVIQFAKIMRVLFADVATPILQLQIKNAQSIDTKKMAEQISASQGVNKIINGYKDNSKRGYGKRRFGSQRRPATTKIKWYKRRHSNQHRDYRMAILKVILSILLGVKDESRDSSRRLPQHFSTDVGKIDKLQLGSKSDRGRIQNTLPDPAKNRG
ncbi:hypothetical protein BB558_002661 [Smittium angustum]|uniref:Uncharacterized protein n=1 Tax=Smittium angustum TaxID=133377 RepID=A0A2U1J812_SMIAN|nr:hypothetical protein BB558_002661 [Smittium angustum]